MPEALVPLPRELQGCAILITRRARLNRPIRTALNTRRSGGGRSSYQVAFGGTPHSAATWNCCSPTTGIHSHRSRNELSEKYSSAIPIV